MAEKRNLAVAILTADLGVKKDGRKYLPKVCHKIKHGKGEITMLEKVIDTVLKLDPKIILLICTKENVTSINKLIREKSYVKKISIHMDNFGMGAVISKNCYNGKNLMVVPGYSPLLTTKTLFRFLHLGSSIKITDNLFYLKQEDLEIIEDIPYMMMSNLEFISELEIIEVHTHGDLDKVNEQLKNKFHHRSNSFKEILKSMKISRNLSKN